MIKRPSRLVRFLSKTGETLLGSPSPCFKDATLVKGCGPWRPGAARELTLAPDPQQQIHSLLTPIPNAPAIFCVGLNYKKHAKEAKMELPRFPVFFLKNPASICGPGDDIKIPRVASTNEVDFEGELAIVIGPRPVKNVSPEDALDFVLGYTSANDVSARRWQGKKGGGQWARGKSFDTFCPLGPSLLLQQSGFDPDNLKIETRLNGETMQSSSTADMNFNVPSLISFLSESTTLLPGTVILTGTPEGVGYAREPPVFFKVGDKVEVEIDGIGVLENTVVEEEVGEHGAKQVWSHALGKMIDP
ncbi:hypothetical protein TrLO_g5364 [Triparma laevis f. longispina]|uniref:Fumarylacetoacetase-like C-terminal domain-containing protein n=1 Tax=Triparma laevis f. longispina TaxID=1714387 RepID=A0A9W7ABQ3_9STRA|nr:hypothetical protein TrLO_g5364 [Triparma laevis f. longispina]